MLRCNIERDPMDRAQQIGWYRRLEQELIEAYTAPSCQPGLIERLTDQLAALARELKHRPPGDEQANDATVPGLIAHD